MTAPLRVQRSRAKGYSSPPNTIYVGRPTRWGNPFLLAGDCDRCREVAVDLYRNMLKQDRKLRLAAKQELKGLNLACFCPLDQPCHADILLEIANE